MLMKKKKTKQEKQQQNNNSNNNPQENSQLLDDEEENDDDENDNNQSYSLASDADSGNSSSSGSSSDETDWTDTDHEEDENDEALSSDMKGNLYRVRRRTLCGTAGYRPPEQVGERYVDYHNRSGYTEAVDYFSLGVTVFIMVAGQRPFPTRKQMIQSQDELISSPSISRRRSSISDHPSAIQRSASRKLMKDIEYKCLQAEVKFPDFLEKDEDGSNVKSFIQQLLAKDPNLRPKFDGIQNHKWMSDVEFDAHKLKSMKLPDWIGRHATAEAKAKPRPMRRSTTITSNNNKAAAKTADLSVTLFIEDILAQMVDIGRTEEAKDAHARWCALPSKSTKELFQHWNYISEDATRLEMEAAANSSNSANTPSSIFASRKRRILRRVTQ